MSVYYITNTPVTSLNFYWGGEEYSDINCISLDDYIETQLYIGDTVIYDLRLALKDGFIDNDTVWKNISLNELSILPKKSNNQDETNNQDESEEEPKTSLIIYADNELLSATWKKITLKRNNFSTFPNFSYLTFDGPEEGILKFYNNTISMEITGFESLSKIEFGCVQKLLTLDISDNGLTSIDIDNMQENIRSITIRNVNSNYIGISESSLEYLDMTNTTTNSLVLIAPKLKTLIGFTPDTLITVQKKEEGEDGEEGELKNVPPSLTLMNFKMPINLENFSSFHTLTLSYNDYFPTGLDTKNIVQLTIIDCKNNNKIREFYINNCSKINLSNIFSLNSVKINTIGDYFVKDENKNGLAIIGNIDLVSLELPKQDLSNIPVTLYANINLSEIIYDGISYGKEDSDKDLVALCEASGMKLFEYNSKETIIANFAKIKHKLGFNKLYIKEKKRNFYNINPQIYKNRELIGAPLTEEFDFDDIIIPAVIKYYYLELPESISVNTTDRPFFRSILKQNVIDYNNININIQAMSSERFIALNLSEYTAGSLVTLLNDSDNGAIIFTDKPNLLKGVKNHIIINPFTYAPDLPNVFGIKLVVY